METQQRKNIQIERGKQMMGNWVEVTHLAKIRQQELLREAQIDRLLRQSRGNHRTRRPLRAIARLFYARAHPKDIAIAEPQPTTSVS
jgi:hypothetical protein